MAKEIKQGDLGPAIYLGLIDDKVAEYPWGDDVTEDYFNDLLIQAALFQRPLLINDGYLLHFDWGRHALSDPSSLFRQLMAEELVIILSREEDGFIDEMPRRQRHLVPSYGVLVDSPEWKTLGPSLKKLRGSPDYRWTAWPRLDNRRGFSKLVESLASKDPEELGIAWHLSRQQLGQCIETFRTLRSRKPDDGARSLWEDAAKAVGNQTHSVLSALMQIGNEAYHYNLGLSAAAATGFATGIATRYSPIFAPRYEVTRTKPDVPPQLEMKMSKLTSPKDQIIDAVRSPTLRAKKQAYLESVEAFRGGASVSQDAGDAYSEEIVRHLANGSSAGSAVLRVGTVALGMVGSAVAVGGAMAAAPLTIPLVLVGFGLATVSTVATAYAPNMLSSWREAVVGSAFSTTTAKAEPSVAAHFTTLRMTGTIWLTEANGTEHTADLKRLAP